MSENVLEVYKESAAHHSTRPRSFQLHSVFAGRCEHGAFAGVAFAGIATIGEDEGKQRKESGENGVEVHDGVVAVIIRQ